MFGELARKPKYFGIFCRQSLKVFPLVSKKLPVKLTVFVKFDMFTVN